jgi:hypothetical protein
MADLNKYYKRWNGSGWDTVYFYTKWDNIIGKPSSIGGLPTVPSGDTSSGNPWVLVSTGAGASPEWVDSGTIVPSSSGSSAEALPERFSIVYNLVVNSNQQQFNAGSSNWTGDNNSSIRTFNYSSNTLATKSQAEALVEHLTGNSKLSEYSANKPQPCFVFCTQSNTCWKLQWDGTSLGLRAYKVNDFPFALKSDINPIIDVTELPNSNINEGKFYRTTKIGEHIKRSVPTDFSTPFANMVFDTTLTVSEVMNIISDDNIAYYNTNMEFSGMTIDFGTYCINWCGNYDEKSVYIVYIPESLGTPFGMLCNQCFITMMLGETPSGNPNVFWCSDGSVLSMLTNGLMELTGWNPYMDNPMELIYFKNEVGSGNVAITNDKLTDLVWCTDFTVYKSVTKVYEDGDSESSYVALCDAFFSKVYSTDLILFDANSIPDASSIYTGIMNGTYPYLINDDGNGGKVITAMFALTTSTTTYEPYTNSTLYMYIAILDTSGTPSVQTHLFADAQTIFSYVLSQQLGAFTIDTSLKKEITLYHYKDEWHEVGVGGGSGLETQILYDHIDLLERQVQANQTKISFSTSSNYVIINLDDGD